MTPMPPQWARDRARLIWRAAQLSPNPVETIAEMLADGERLIRKTEAPPLERRSGSP